MLLSIEEVRGLPIIPPYMPGELTQSHFQRIADKNVLRMSQLNEILLTVLEHKQMDTKSTSAVAAMSKILGHPSELTKHMHFSAYFVKPAHRDSTRSVCPDCLSEERPTPVFFGGQVCSICPFHSVALVCRCSSCHRRLAWGRGDYCHCVCGFDLRTTLTVDIDAETHSFFLSCLLGQQLTARLASTQLKIHPHASNHLSTAIQYLMQDGGIRDLAKAKTQGIHAWLPHDIGNWLAIGQRIGSCPIKLMDVVTAIEARHILTKSQPQHLVSQAEELFDAISWAHLRELAEAARSNASNLEPCCNLTLTYGIGDFDNRSTQKQLVSGANELSPFLRREFQIALGRQFAKPPPPDSPADTTATRINELARNLCHIHTPNSRKMAPLSMTSMVMSFIAVGVLTPWVAAPFEQWHIDLRDIANALRKLNVRQWRKEMSIPDGACVYRFPVVFDLTNRPSDWLHLHFYEVGLRVDALLRGVPLTLDGRTYSEHQLMIPIGICAFLSPEDCDLYCSCDVNNLLFFRMICNSREQAAKALNRACLRAQKHYRQLTSWAKVAADVADRYLLGGKFGHTPIQQTASANRRISYFEQYPHKALQAAIHDLGGHEMREKFVSVSAVDILAGQFNLI